jgi:hypothetical protein
LQQRIALQQCSRKSSIARKWKHLQAVGILGELHGTAAIPRRIAIGLSNDLFIQPEPHATPGLQQLQ